MVILKISNAIRFTLNQEDSSVSPIQSRKRRRGRNHKLDDSDEDFQPNNEGPESEDDVSSHYSPSPKQQRTKPRNIMNRRVSTSSNDADGDFVINEVDNDDDGSPHKKSNGHSNHNGHRNNKSNGIKPRHAAIGLTGDESLDVITSFQHNDDDDDRKQSESNSPQRTSRYSSYADYKRKSKKRLNPSKKVQASGASHRKVSDAEWFTNPKDHKGRTRDDPNCNIKQIHVPRYALQQMTPAQRQYWDFKKDAADGILFFKVGKFYEIYCEDALIGHKLLGMNLMKGEEPHVGFPEKSLRKFVDMFTSHGYNVCCDSICEFKHF